MTKGKVLIIGIIAVLAVLLLAFGGAPESDDTNTLRVALESPPDSLDPQISYMGTSWQMQANVYNGLLTYKKTDGPEATELIPNLATALPEITNGGKTLKFQMRKGVMFGPPTNREVLPSDLKYTFDRLALIPSQGAFYYSVIEGFDDFMKSRKGSVPGVVADDKARTITFNLTRPDATFLNVLAMPFSAVVPKGTPANDQSQKGFIPATGPYMFTSYDPASNITLKRNPNFKVWDEIAMPKGNVDKIHVKLKVSSDNAITMIRQGLIDVNIGSIPRSKLPEIMNDPKWSKHIHSHEKVQTSYIFMNVNTPPFDNLKVRQAVNHAIDRKAMVKIGGGAGIPSSTILPPQMPGYTGKEVYPEMNMKEAKRLIKESGVNTKQKITIFCFSAEPSPQMAQYLQEQLKALGFNARTRCTDSSAYYGIVGAEKSKTQIGFGAWGADFPEGSNFIDVLLNGRNINPDHSVNISFYRGMDDEITRVNNMLDLEKRAELWGELDEKLQIDAPWAPIQHPVARLLVSERLGNYKYHPVYDLMFMHVTVDGKGTPNAEYHEYEVPLNGKEDDDEEDGGDH